MNLNFLDWVYKNTQTSDITEIRPVVAELFRAVERTDRQA